MPGSPVNEINQINQINQIRGWTAVKSEISKHELCWRHDGLRFQRIKFSSTTFHLVDTRVFKSTWCDDGESGSPERVLPIDKPPLPLIKGLSPHRKDVTAVSSLPIGNLLQLWFIHLDLSTQKRKIYIRHQSFQSPPPPPPPPPPLCAPSAEPAGNQHGQPAGISSIHQNQRK